MFNNAKNTLISTEQLKHLGFILLLNLAVGVVAYRAGYAAGTPAYTPPPPPPPPIVEPELEKRYLWWVAGVIWKTLELVFSWQGLVDSCEHFTESAWNGAQCVYGAVSTALVYGGAAVKAGKAVGHLASWQNTNAIQIIPLGNLGNAATVASAVQNSTGLSVSHSGTYWIPKNNLKVRGVEYDKAEIEPAAIFNIVHEQAGKHHMMMLHFPAHNMTKLRMGHGHVQLSTSHKRSDYDEQAFQNGGIDFDIDEEEGEGGTGQLSTDNDFQDMFNQVQCNMEGHMSDNNCMLAQIFDNNAKGTIAGGALVPYSSSDDADLETNCFNNYRDSLPITPYDQCTPS